MIFSTNYSLANIKRLQVVPLKPLDNGNNGTVVNGNGGVDGSGSTISDDTTQRLPDLLDKLFQKYREKGCTEQEIIDVLEKLNIEYSNTDGKIEFLFNDKTYTMQFSEVNEAENSVGNTGNNITAEDLEALYYSYLSTGAGGKDAVVLTYGFMIIEDGSTPQEKAKEIIEEYLKNNNITNITSDEILVIFGEIDKRLDSEHAWADRKGAYDSNIILGMKETILSVCKAEAGKAALTDENWADLNNIYATYYKNEDELFYKLKEYLVGTDTGLFPGDVMEELEAEYVKSLLGDNPIDSYNVFKA